jgi:quinohemoprotein ethanol dehydrogenase
VDSLKLDWYIDLPDSRSLVSTPLVADGIMYFISSMNIVRAVDATSGEELWKFNPQVAQYAASRMRAGWDNSRGIGIWEDKVFVATWDGRLIGIGGNNGRELWSVQTIDPELAMYITGAPKIFKGKVLIGNGGTEHGPNRSYILPPMMQTLESKPGVSESCPGIRPMVSKTPQWRRLPKPGLVNGGVTVVGVTHGMVSPTMPN